MSEVPFGELIDLVRKGDQDAAAELVERHASAVRRVVRFRLADTRLRSVFDSMDICQSVLASFFVRAAAGQYDLDTPDQLVRLLAVMARNKFVSHARKEQAHRYDNCRPEDAFADDVGLQSAEPDPAHTASARELCAKALGLLSIAERELVDLRHQGLDWESIARDRQGTPVALRKQLSRALDRVLQELGLE